jgi:hypothetical protein
LQDVNFNVNNLDSLTDEQLLERLRLLTQDAAPLLAKAAEPREDELDSSSRAWTLLKGVERKKRDDAPSLVMNDVSCTRRVLPFLSSLQELIGILHSCTEHKPEGAASDFRPSGSGPDLGVRCSLLMMLPQELGTFCVDYWDFE